MAQIGQFALVPSGNFCNDSAFLITGQELEYLCGMLNSMLSAWYVQTSGYTTSFGVPQWKKFIVQEVPVACPAENVKESIKQFVNQIVESDYEIYQPHFIKEIEELTFEIYDLNAQEKSFLKTKFQKSGASFLSCKR